MVTTNTSIAFLYLSTNIYRNICEKLKSSDNISHANILVRLCFQFSFSSFFSTFNYGLNIPSNSVKMLCFLNTEHYKNRNRRDR